MFDMLSSKIQSAIDKMVRKGRIDEKVLENGLREIKFALLEADVNYKIVSEFISEIKEKALGKEVTSGVTASQQLVKIVHDELVKILGSETSKLKLLSKPSVILLVGLQGSGKTTTAAKLGLKLKNDGRKVMLTSTDIYRPAAMLQLKKLCENANLEVFIKEDITPEEIVLKALKISKEGGFDALIIDTAGRLHIDEYMMNEIKKIKEIARPDEILFVTDAMAGQEIVNVAKRFNENVEITGVILTKLDSDTRGGVALSVKGITGKPIKFAGTGEKLEDLEYFHPDRVASRILGMGDIVSLVEKAQKVIDEKEAEDIQKKLLGGDFTLEDFQKQIKMIQKMGSLRQIIRLIPGLSSQKVLKQLDKLIDEKKVKRVEAIINSMTIEERRNHTIINASRKRRIARGSGTSVKEVEALIKQFAQAKMMMKNMKKLSKKMKKKNLPFPFMNA